MPDPLRSPKQSRVAAKNRSHPYARPANSHRVRGVGLPRSNSLLGTIKSFVTAPLSWLSSRDSPESNGSPQKRRVSVSERGGTPPRTKRPRHDSPEVAGYLDPPSSLFSATNSPLAVGSGIDGHGLVPTRTASLDASSPSTDFINAPLPPSRGPSILSRTSMSVEPQVLHSLRRSKTRDLSIPPPSPFAHSYARSSLTPQPCGATFGPSPKRKARESTAPPLLYSPAPKFTRAPMPSERQGLFPRSQSREMSEGPISSLLGRNRKSVSPVRETSSHALFVREEVPQSKMPGKDNAERTLSALESYRTPLHMSRFPSTISTGNYRPRKVHVPLPSKLRFDHIPEGQKEKVKRVPAVVGPYSSGTSGMRKLLARRREELEREAIIDIENGVLSGQTHEANVERVSDKAHEAPSKEKETVVGGAAPSETHPQINGIVAKTDAQLPRTRSPPRSKLNGPYSSLRAPSNKINRTHAPAPKLKNVRNKFALDDDDDTEWDMSVEDVRNFEVQAAQAQPPISFSATRSMSETGMQTDTDSVSPLRPKTPPFPSQPQTFDSLLSRIGSPVPISATSFPAAPASPPKPDVESEFTKAAGGETSSAPSALPFGFGTSSTPKHVEPSTNPFVSDVTTPPAPAIAPAASTGGAVPSFFANTRAQFTPPTVPTGSLFGGPLPSTKQTDSGEQAKNISGDEGKQKPSEKTEAQEGRKKSLFVGVGGPSVFGGPSASVFGSEVSKVVNVTDNPPVSTTSSFSGFGTPGANVSNDAPKPIFVNDPPAGVVTEPTRDINVFGAASKPDASLSTSGTDTSSKRVFPFAASSPSSLPPAGNTDTNSETSANATSSKQVLSLDAQPQTSAPSAEAPKSPFPFGAPALSTQLTGAVPDAAKTPFAVGATPSTPPPPGKKSLFPFGNMPARPVSGFPFGSNNLPSSGANGTSAEGLKPAFVGFGNTGLSTQKKAESTQAEGGDGMEVNGGDRMEESPTRAVDKKDVPVPPFASFGAGSSSGGFSFGQGKATLSTGSFSFSQSKPSTSTGFSFGQTADKSSTSPNTGVGFTFGQGANKPVTASPSTGFTFGSDTQKPAQLSFGAPLNNPFGGGSASGSASSTNFSFGQSSPNVNANPFGQPQQPENNTLSTSPSSPSLFPQQTSQQSQSQSPSFSFAVPASNAFSSSNSVAGPSANGTTQPFQFGASGTAQQQQPSATSGNTMFTLGGAATPTRKVKGLPTRRGRRS